MTFDELSSKMLSQLAEDIRKEIQDKGLKDTGSTGDSLEVNGNELLANQSLYYLVHGRAPGKFPPVDNIRDWVRRKLGVEDKQVNGVAFLVGRKISEEGTTIFKDKSKGVNLDGLIEKMHEEIMAELVNILTEINPDRIDEFIKINFSTFK